MLEAKDPPLSRSVWCASTPIAEPELAVNEYAL